VGASGPAGRLRRDAAEARRLHPLGRHGACGGLERIYGSKRGQGTAEWAPAIDVVRKDDDLVVRAELPGAKPEDVEVTVHQGVLTISGKREEQREEERGEYLVRERRSGSFRRSLQLPEGIDEDSIRARFDNGVLEVTVEGAAAAQGPKRIQLEGG
jgi:HSP20 family protein